MAWVFASLSKLSVFVSFVCFFSQSAGFLEMERAVLNLLFLNEIGETWHMCLRGCGVI